MRSLKARTKDPRGAADYIGAMSYAYPPPPGAMEAQAPLVVQPAAERPTSGMSALKLLGIGLLLVMAVVSFVFICIMFSDVRNIKKAVVGADSSAAGSSAAAAEALSTAQAAARIYDRINAFANGSAKLPLVGSAMVGAAFGASLTFDRSFDAADATLFDSPMDGATAKGLGVASASDVQSAATTASRCGGGFGSRVVIASSTGISPSFRFALQLWSETPANATGRARLWVGWDYLNYAYGPGYVPHVRRAGAPAGAL